MRIFLTGANGWIGSAIASELIDAGHEVVGLVRSEEKGAALVAKGGSAFVGSLDDLEVLKQAASDVDAVIHTAFGLDFSRMEALAAEDRKAIEAFGEVFAGSPRPILVTGGFLVGDGTTVDEFGRPPFNPSFPRASEQTAFALADKGIHASVVRNPRSVHGKGEAHGFVPMLAEVARETGVSAYVGDGSNRWPAVHRLDSARLYRLAIERGAGGEAYHAVAEEGVPYREIAEAIGRQIGVPSASMVEHEAQAHFGWLASFVMNDGPASHAWTTETLGWSPREVGIVADIERASYSDKLSGSA